MNRTDPVCGVEAKCRRPTNTLLYVADSRMVWRRFGSFQGLQLQKVSAWLPDSAAKQAAASGKGKMSFVDYDWGLNAFNR